MANSCWPGSDVLAELHRRLLAGDPLAPSDFAAAALGPLVNDLRGENRGTDDHLCLTAAEDAVLAVARNPVCYDPSRGELPAYLRMAARGDLRNALEKEGRHHRKRDHEIPVEEAADGRNDPVDDDLPSFDDPRLAAAIDAFSDVERQVLELMRAGERDTEAFAALLGVADRAVEQRRAEVHRVKDRIIRRLKRAVGGS